MSENEAEENWIFNIFRKRDVRCNIIRYTSFLNLFQTRFIAKA
jgi:hypothetical protein